MGKAQALSDDSRSNYMKGRKTLEINPRHPIIKELKEKQAENEDSETTKLIATLLYETALLESGFMVDDTKGFATRMSTMIKSSLDIDPDAEVEEEEEEEEVEEEVAEEVEESEEEEEEEVKD